MVTFLQSTSVMEFLSSKIGERVILGVTTWQAPLACEQSGPLLPRLQLLVSTLKPPPASLNVSHEQQKTVTESFANIMDEDRLRKMERHTNRRAEVCMRMDGGYFEPRLYITSNTSRAEK